MYKVNTWTKETYRYKVNTWIKETYRYKVNTWTKETYRYKVNTCTKEMYRYKLVKIRILTSCQPHSVTSGQPKYCHNTF